MKKYFTLFFLIISINWLLAQEPPVKEKQVNEVLDELFMEDELLDELIASLSKFQFLYISLNFNSDTYFSGRDIGIDQYNLSPQISYIHSNGFFASLSGTYYSEFNPNWDVTNATIGYGKSIGKQKLLKYFIAYSKYFYINDFDYDFTNSLNIGLGIKNKNNTIGTQLSGALLFGNSQSYQIVLRNYAQINILKTKNNSLRFRPQLSFITGEQTVELDQIDAQTGISIMSNSFRLINTQLNFPLQYSHKSFDIELGYTLNFPNALSSEGNLSSTNFINFTFAYLIDL
jgi:hypothetical protein